MVNSFHVAHEYVLGLRLLLVPVGLLVPVLLLGDQLLQQHLFHAGLDGDLVARAVVAVGHGYYVVRHADLHGDGDVARGHLEIKKNGRNCKKEEYNTIYETECCNFNLHKLHISMNEFL